VIIINVDIARKRKKEGPICTSAIIKKRNWREGEEESRSRQSSRITRLLNISRKGGGRLVQSPHPIQKKGVRKKKRRSSSISDRAGQREGEEKRKPFPP